MKQFLWGRSPKVLHSLYLWPNIFLDVFFRMPFYKIGVWTGLLHVSHGNFPVGLQPLLITFCCLCICCWSHSVSIWLKWNAAVSEKRIFGQHLSRCIFSILLVNIYICCQPKLLKRQSISLSGNFFPLVCPIQWIYMKSFGFFFFNIPLNFVGSCHL